MVLSAVDGPTCISGLTSTSSSNPSKRSRTEPNANEAFYIINVQTGAYASLLGDEDRCAIVTTNDSAHISSGVSLTSFILIFFS